MNLRTSGCAYHQLLALTTPVDFGEVDLLIRLAACTFGDSVEAVSVGDVERIVGGNGRREDRAVPC